ncbi:putative halogenase [Mycena epipterygia]|nr:putative halogenase [Mycena epipterygia]
MSQTSIPSSTDILVIGGGPAGAYAASALAREGFQVTLLERDVFPRYHIGESMLPSARSFLRFIDVEDKVLKHGFTVKVGAAVKLNQHKREGYTDFIARDPNNFSWNVVRSEFDELLLRHAGESGAAIHEGVRVNTIKFSEENPQRPVAAEWKSEEGTGEIKFNWLVDASGRNGMMSTKYLKNRKFNASLRNVAFWGYWTGAGKYGKGTKRENAPWFEALTDETGWVWFIPLHDNKVSIGVVLSEASSKVKKAKITEADSNKAHYLTQLQLAPGAIALLGEGKLIGEVQSAGDYSYSATAYGGPGYRIAGDAAAFIDPFFSSGVHLAFTGGLSAASTIAASIRGHCTEEEAIAFHNDKIGVGYTRFLLVVLGIYKQINSQESPVFSDINEDNFDRAFDFLRPIIQGAADTDRTVTENHIQSTLDFCAHALGGATPEMHEKVAKRLDPALMAADGPVMSTKAVAAAVGEEDEEAKQVVWGINSRKAVNTIYDWEDNFRGEAFNGWIVTLKRGRLGLERTVAA